MQSIKIARTRSKDPRQEAVRSAKDVWNKDVSKLIDDLIHFKKMINGYPSKFFAERSKITNPLPVKPSQVLQLISNEYSSIAERADNIEHIQNEYAGGRVKKASNKFTRFLSYLKGPYFGSSFEAIARRDRVSLLKYASDIYYSFKKLNSNILGRDLDSVHRSKAIFNKLGNEIYVFDSFFKTIQEPEKTELLEESKPKQEPVKNENESKELSDEEVDNLYKMYNEDHRLFDRILELLPKMFAERKVDYKITTEQSLKLKKELVNRFIKSFSDGNIKSKKHAIEFYQRICEIIFTSITESFDKSFNKGTASRIYEWLRDQPEFKKIEAEENANAQRAAEEAGQKEESLRLKNQEIQLKEKNKQDFKDNIGLIVELLKNINEANDFVNKMDEINVEELVNSSGFSNKYSEILLRLKTFLISIKKSFNKETENKLKLTYSPSSFEELKNLIIFGLKNEEKPEEPTKPKEEPVKKLSRKELILKDLEENPRKLFLRGARSDLKSKVPDGQSTKLGLYYQLSTGWKKYNSDFNLTNEENEELLVSKYKELLSNLKHDFALFGFDTSEVRSLKKLEEISASKTATGQVSKITDWGKRKMHEFSFWEKTSPIRLKISDLAVEGKRISDKLMDILESNIDFEIIKDLMKQIISIYLNAKKLVIVLSQITSNVKFEGNIDNLLSDRYDFDSDLAKGEAEDLLKALQRQRRTRMLRELG